MPVFTKQLRNMETSTPQEAVKIMADHIRYIQEQLEYTLNNLDSSNIREIETDKTDITSSSGGTSLTGDSFTLKGSNGEEFSAGVSNGTFRFKLNGKNGVQILYLNSAGELVITRNAAIHIDCGEW